MNGYRCRSVELLLTSSLGMRAMLASEVWTAKLPELLFPARLYALYISSYFDVTWLPQPSCRITSEISSECHSRLNAKDPDWRSWPDFPAPCVAIGESALREINVRGDYH